MTKDSYKIIGILSTVIYLITAIFLYKEDNSAINSGNIFSFKLIIYIISIFALFFIYYSASEIIKELSPFNFKIYVYFLGSIYAVYIILYFINLDPKSLYNTYNILYILLYVVLGIIAVKLLKIKNPELNIKYFRIFVLSNLLLLFLINTLSYLLIEKMNILNLSYDEILMIIQKIKLLNFIPYFFALIFFIKPYKTIS